MAKNPKIGDLVLVEWEDSAQPSPAWQFLSDMGRPEAIHCLTAGWLLTDGPVKAIAQNMGDTGKESAQVSGVIRIPARCIIKIKKLK